MKDIRCQGRMVGRLGETQGRIAWETKCSSRVCGAGPGIVVLHRFDANTGELLDTRRFRDPGAVKMMERGEQ